MFLLLVIGIAMFAGLFLSRLTSRWNLPDVTSYLIAGLLVGPLCLGQLGVPGLGFASFEMVEAMGLISGMFYTTRNDMLGRFLSHSIYGKDERSKAIAQYTNPEHPEIINNIPPCYLITSKADMLERYTLDFAGELGNKGIKHYLRHMGSDPKLLHAFPVLNASLPESELNTGWGASRTTLMMLTPRLR